MASPVTAVLRPLAIEHRVRRCDTCGETYWRRNLTEVWVVRNEGHRRGWQKVIVRQCMACQTAEQSRRMLFAAQVAWERPRPRRHAKLPSVAERLARKLERAKR